MPIAFILLVVGVVLVAGGIKNWSIPDLFIGKIVDKGGSSGDSSDDTSGGTSSTTSPATGSNIVDIAKQFLGVPYRYGGNDPSIGIDCSRFVQMVFASVGVSLGRTTYDQYKQGTPVSISNLKPGDVIFVRPTPEGPEHEGLYVGNNEVQESPQTGEVNKFVPLQSFLGDGLVGVRRYI